MIRFFKNHFRTIILIAAVAVSIAIVVGLIWSTRPEKTPPDGYFSEEQAEARLATLQAAQKEQAAEVVPMKFFTEEIRPDTGTFSVTAITTMPEDTIAEVSFQAFSKEDPEKVYWYDSKKQGGGSYLIEGSVADLGNKEGTYVIRAFITPKGGDETEAGETEIEISLTDYFYSEALGEGRQSLVLVHPSAGKDSELKGVTFKVWTEEGGQEDMSTYQAEKKKDNVWYAEIALEDFANRGDFVANAYAQIGDTETGIASAAFKLLPEPMKIPEGEGQIVREGKRVYVKVPEILQEPELPTGCESVALTIVLSSLGYKLEKTEIAKDWLPRGDNLATTYVGDPFSYNGAGCFPPAIVSTADDYLEEHGDSRRGHNITGTPIEDLCEYIDHGTPVIMWSSSYMAYPSRSGNVVTFRGQTYEWYSSEHCLVLYGYDKEKNVYLVSDPLVGLVERNMSDFEAIYNEIGKYAVVIY